jgi:Flp pilus assembly protein protease CpaA
MFEIIFLFTLALIWIIAATIQDLRKKEVANWINFSLIIFALGFRFFYCLFEQGNFMFFYQGLIGLGIFFVLANFFYYSRIFAGGDAKLMMALGAILPISNDFLTNLRSFLLFLFLFFIVGSIYGLGWSLVLLFKNFKPFKKTFKKIFKKNQNVIFVMMFAGLFFMILGFYLRALFLIGLFIFISPYFFIYAKAIDDSTMIQKINVKDLREGDWLYAKVKVGKRTIHPSWDGLNMKDIHDIRKKHKYVRIKQGVVFVPVFLIAFVIYAYGILRGISIFSSLGF